jgi:hypothetical protein
MPSDRPKTLSSKPINRSRNAEKHNAQSTLGTSSSSFSPSLPLKLSRQLWEQTQALFLIQKRIQDTSHTSSRSPELSALFHSLQDKENVWSFRSPLTASVTTMTSDQEVRETASIVSVCAIDTPNEREREELSSYLLFISL